MKNAEKAVQQHLCSGVELRLVQHCSTCWDITGVTRLSMHAARGFLLALGIGLRRAPVGSKWRKSRKSWWNSLRFASGFESILRVQRVSCEFTFSPESFNGNENKRSEEQMKKI